ncbi:MAG: hypothetical protein CO145_01090 [Candidatus Nealsonbacteria bacterium CG_4_9_14_3_um_filter_37_13]|uniref:Uncharacterized protein n=2 Tax=Candidatus Nealsoniibacteriota TaxID=1817911 RepID=A0A2H0TJA5_9BACT|nr:MAG: hypothetical protein COU43_01555 [Candidatus Nealsonbacteria bacterium CG10_big_fil_rev_8_21_14_0_10_37_25]PJA84497.1 MAG: hypothetical protein CO145_01090 [Candidatus Nealsonbacteria bacterium CG_4_9_14_3_um_filter_37_13]
MKNLVIYFYIFPAFRAGSLNLFGREQNCSAAEPRSGEAALLTNLVWRDILKLARTYFEKNF